MTGTSLYCFEWIILKFGYICFPYILISWVEHLADMLGITRHRNTDWFSLYSDYYRRHPETKVWVVKEASYPSLSCSSGKVRVIKEKKYGTSSLERCTREEKIIDIGTDKPLLQKKYIWGRTRKYWNRIHGYNQLLERKVIIVWKKLRFGTIKVFTSHHILLAFLFRLQYSLYIVVCSVTRSDFLVSCDIQTTVENNASKCCLKVDWSVCF